MKKKHSTAPKAAKGHVIQNLLRLLHRFMQWFNLSSQCAERMHTAWTQAAVLLLQCLTMTSFYKWLSAQVPSLLTITGSLRVSIGIDWCVAHLPMISVITFGNVWQSRTSLTGFTFKHSLQGTVSHSNKGAGPFLIKQNTRASKSNPNSILQSIRQNRARCHEQSWTSCRRAALHVLLMNHTT